MRLTHRLFLTLSTTLALCEVHAADEIAEDFNGAAVSPLLSLADGYVFGSAAHPIGSIQNTVARAYRDFVATRATDYNLSDFVFEITAFVRSGGPGEGAFIGLGGNFETSPGAFPEPNHSIYLRIFPSGFGGYTDVSISPDATLWDVTRLSQPPEPAEGTYRIRITHQGNSLTLACMTNYA